MPDQQPSGFWHWLGRQVGHVKKAVETNVEAEAERQAQGDPETQVVYRNETVQELPHPANPDLTLRRRVVDEVLQTPPKTLPPADEASGAGQG
jgi:hypothetical protein